MRLSRNGLTSATAALACALLLGGCGGAPAAPGSVLLVCGFLGRFDLDLHNVIVEIEYSSALLVEIPFLVVQEDLALAFTSATDRG